MRYNVLENIDRFAFAFLAYLACKTDRLVALTFFDYLVKRIERAAAYKENVFGVYLYKLLVGVLSAALRRNVCRCSFKNFEERLMYALARNVTRYRTVFTAARNLVEFVDINDAFFGKT